MSDWPGFWIGCRSEFYLVLPRVTSATPWSSPKVILMSRKASRARPSRRISSLRASRMNARSMSDGSASRGMIAR